jgi:hypothetical protein
MPTDVLVGRLGRKTEPDAGAPSLIVTVAGAGYKFTLRCLTRNRRGPPRSTVPRLGPRTPDRLAKQAHINKRRITVGVTMKIA